MKNRTWRLAAWPQGMPKETDGMPGEKAMPLPGLGQLLVRAHYRDVAPCMRGRISPRKNDARGVSSGDVMVGGVVGKVIESRNEAFAVGDTVVTDCAFGWREYAALDVLDAIDATDAFDARDVRRVRCMDTGLAFLPCWPDFFGINGLSVYFALFDTGALKEKDAAAISAVAGSVGQIAGQLARMASCRTLGFTRSNEKAVFCAAPGYDEVINDRAFPDLVRAVAQRCPKGVDLFIDNMAGAIRDAIMVNLVAYARVVIAGTASLAARLDAPRYGPAVFAADYGGLRDGARLSRFRLCRAARGSDQKIGRRISRGNDYVEIRYSNRYQADASRIFTAFDQPEYGKAAGRGRCMMEEKTQWKKS